MRQMANFSTLLSWVVGGIQCIAGGLATVFAFLTFASSSTRDSLSIASDETYLYMFLFTILGVFLISSGLVLVWEGKKGAKL